MARYSQNSEEDVIVQYFDGQKGKYIDIGAYDPFRLSNTRRLYELGWEGVLVEADPTNYKAIADHYRDDPRIKVFGFAIGVSEEPLEFYTSGGDAVSTSDEAHKVKWEGGGVKFEKITVPQVHVVNFMAEHYMGCRFLSIDTEATNMDIFRAMPEFVWNEIKMLCIEHDLHHEEIERTLEPFGFKKLLFNAENIILAK